MQREAHLASLSSKVFITISSIFITIFLIIFIIRIIFLFLSTSADYSTSTATLLTGWGRVEEGGPWSPKVSPTTYTLYCHHTYTHTPSCSVHHCHKQMNNTAISSILLSTIFTLLFFFSMQIKNYFLFPVEKDPDPDCV